MAALRSIALSSARTAGAAAVSAGLCRLPRQVSQPGALVRRLLAEAPLPRKALVRGDGHAVLARHGRGLSFGRGDRQSAALRARAGGRRLYRRRPADGAGAEIQRPHRSRAMDGALDGAGRRRTCRRRRCGGAGAAALAALLSAAGSTSRRSWRARSQRLPSKPFDADGDAPRQGHAPAGRACGHPSAQDNVRAAFMVPPEHEIAVRGRRVLVVDDVYTTGATVCGGDQGAEEKRRGRGRRADLRARPAGGLPAGRVKALYRFEAGQYRQ